MLSQYNDFTTSFTQIFDYQEPSQSFDGKSGNRVPSNHSVIINDCDDASQDEEENFRSKSNSSAIGKSFTIAAILGLTDGQCEFSGTSDRHTDVTTCSLSNQMDILNCNRLRISISRPNSNTVLGQYTNSHINSAHRANGRAFKHISSTMAQSKRNCKAKRVRTIFTPEQLERLEAEFERQQYMVGPERLYLAHTLHLTEAQVKVWFQNRRIKWRKHHLELTHQRLAVLKQQQLLMDESHADCLDTNSSSRDT